MAFNVRCWTRLPAALADRDDLLEQLRGEGSDVSPCACPPVVEYSRAEQARVADEVAALPEGALIVDPRLLVLDKPTCALDVSVQATVLQVLERSRREQGVALQFVSHDLNVVRRLCSRIIVMYLGQIVESGDTATLFHAPAHPYTKAVQSAIHRKPGRVQRDWIRLDGDPQSLIDPTGLKCRLYGRCPSHHELCGLSEPDLRPIGDGWKMRCHPADPEGTIPLSRPRKGAPDA